MNESLEYKNIERRYWQWEEYLNQTEFRLRSNIQELIKKGLVKRTSIDLQYMGINETLSPWIIVVDEEGCIASISYREFFFFKDDDIGKLNMANFIAKLNPFLCVTDEYYKGDRLCVVFRDSFLAVAILTRSLQ